MSFNPLELKALSEPDLAALLEAMHALAATKNRVALDLLCVIEKEILARHQPTDIGDYTDSEIATATTTFACAVDTSRDHGVPDDYPALRFILLTITALVDEMEKRDMVKQVQ